TAAELDGLWKDLAGDDAAKAYQAAWALDAAPEQAAKLLRERATAAPKVDAARVAKLIAALDDDEYDTREAASKELAALGKSVEDALRAGRKKGASPEARYRIDVLLEQFVKGTGPSEERAKLRAVEVLERLGTKEAREALAELAKGPADAELTREAN